MWDLRAFKKPLAVHSGLGTLYPSTNAVFSPDDKYVLTGAGAAAKGGQGRLVILAKEGLEEVKSLAVDTTPVKVAWHSKINQVRKALPFVRVECLSVDAGDMTLIDRDRAIERTNCGTLLASDVAERGEATAEQGPAAQGDDRGCVGRTGNADDPDAACAADVPRPGPWAGDEAQAREGAHGSEEEQTA